jgi:hypothetical protein
LKLLIISESVSQSFFSEVKCDFSLFDLVIDVNLGEYNFNNINFSFRNLIELVQQLETHNIIVDEITLFSGILKYSSEINIRVLLSGFTNIVKSRFCYVDSKFLFERKIFMTDRCLLAIAKNPSLVESEKLITLNFDVNQKSWLNHTYEHMNQLIERNRVSQLSFLSKVDKAITNKQPFSFVRLNHCENRLMGQGVTFTKAEADITYKRQFGYMLNERDTSYISYRIKMSVKNSDVIGVPDTKKNSTNKLHLLENTTFFHLSHFSLVSSQSFVNVNTHYYLGQSIEFKNLLQSCPRLVAITCRDLSELQCKINRKINVINIPAQSYFLGDEEETKKHFPDRFFEIENEIETMVEPGTLVLIGAGILGKIYCDMVKKAGGVAVDVGSLMDAIVKKDTRGVGFDKFDFWWN